jgi:hypothetical protein
LHDFRNRLAHHQPVWNREPQDRYEDLLTLSGYIDPALPGWIEVTSTVGRVLDSEPRACGRRRGMAAGSFNDTYGRNPFRRGGKQSQFGHSKELGIA